MTRRVDRGATGHDAGTKLPLRVSKEVPRPRLMRTLLGDERDWWCSMFEDSVLSLGPGSDGGGFRLSSLAAIVFESAIAAFLIITPLFHPLRLPASAPAPPLFVPRLHEAPRRPMERVHVMSTNASAVSLPSSAANLQAPRLPPRAPETAPVPELSLTPIWAPGAGTPPAAVVGMASNGTRVSVTSAGGGGSATGAARGPVRVSSGVSAGLLLAPIRPVYPQIARAAQVQGTVVVQAVISRDGVITEARVTAGPPMLAQAALDAVRSARYRPFRLNGAPTEVETTFSIVFRLGSL